MSTGYGTMGLQVSMESHGALWTLVDNTGQLSK